MAGNEEQLRILKMIEQGQITAEDGTRLLEALNAANERRLVPAAGAETAAMPSGRWFRVRVTDLQTGKSKLNVNIPVGLVNVGIKMGARFAPEVEGRDLTELAQLARSGATGKLIEVEDAEKDELIEIFVE